MESARISQWVAGRSGRTSVVLPENPLVLIVDDHPGDWTRLGSILEASGISMNVSGDMPEYLVLGRQRGILCLILELRPGRDCFDFQQRLAAANVFVPIIFVTTSGNISMSVTAMKNGAIDFLAKPLNDQELYSSIQIGLDRDNAWYDESRQLSALAERYQTLTARERQVMEKVVAGRLNKQVGGDLGISEITVKAHRGQVMRKMRAKSLPDLTRMADKIAQITQSSNAKMGTEIDVVSTISMPNDLTGELARLEAESRPSAHARWPTRIRRTASRLLSIIPAAANGRKADRRFQNLQ